QKLPPCLHPYRLLLRDEDWALEPYIVARFSTLATYILQAVLLDESYTLRTWWCQEVSASREPDGFELVSPRSGCWASLHCSSALELGDYHSRVRDLLCASSISHDWKRELMLSLPSSCVINQ
ncbi:hypothetical protein HAX54_039127, partial [Datura stramonium]|nr:hypothetical protein [Datura stramonium]